jgi:hypothetical protein
MTHPPDHEPPGGDPTFAGYQQAPPPGGYYPPPYGYPGPPPYRPTNDMAVVSLIMAFVFAPLGIVFGVIARKQIRERGEEGEGLALAGLITSIVFTALWVIGIIAFIAFFATMLDRIPDTGTEVTTPR